MKTEKSIIIGKRLREARELKGLTQTEVMKIRGYDSTSTVSSHESGDRTPKAVELYELSKLYDASMDWIHGDTNIMNPAKGKIELSGEELELLKAYREASNRDKEITKRLLQSTPFEQTS